MPFPPKKAYRTLSFLGVFLFGLSGLEAYEQGSYLILDIVEKKAETAAAPARPQIERSHFVASKKPNVPSSEVSELSPELLAGINIESSKPSAFDDSNVEVIDVTLKSSSFGTDTTDSSGSTFGIESSSVFGE